MSSASKFLNDTLPPAGSGSSEEIRKVRQLIQLRGLVGVANNTKWNELISFVRSLDGWRPSYRYRWVNGYTSGWDTEWFYHLPFPFIGIEWLDIGLHQIPSQGSALTAKIIDHRNMFASQIKRIGLEYEANMDIMRIWGYLPKSYDDFQ